MAVTTRLGVGWAARVPRVARRRLLALAVSPVLALVGMLIAPAVPAEADFGCSFFDNTNASVTVTDPGGKFMLLGQEFAGHYNGVTVQPSATAVTDAGKEAQCLLKRINFYTDHIDGIFGPNSQAAAEHLQDVVNSTSAAGIQEDGMVGPQTWPWLRCAGQGLNNCTFIRE